MIYPNWNAVRTELTWTHYRLLLRVKTAAAREWYAKEAIEQSWSSRALDRQISTLFYERLLSSQNKKSVEIEAQFLSFGKRILLLCVVCSKMVSLLLGIILGVMGKEKN